MHTHIVLRMVTQYTHNLSLSLSYTRTHTNAFIYSRNHVILTHTCAHAHTPTWKVLLTVFLLLPDVNSLKWSIFCCTCFSKKMLWKKISTFFFAHFAIKKIKFEREKQWNRFQKQTQKNRLVSLVSDKYSNFFLSLYGMCVTYEFTTKANSLQKTAFHSLHHDTHSHTHTLKEN